MREKKLMLLLMISAALLISTAACSRSDVGQQGGNAVAAQEQRLQLLGANTAHTSAPMQLPSHAGVTVTTPHTPQATSTQNPSLKPTATGAAQSAPTPTSVPPSAPVQSAPTASAAYRYFPANASVSAIQSGASALSRQQVKSLIEKEIDGSWSVIQGTFGFTTKEKAYAFFLGMATRESTLNAGLETGSGPSHSYGPLQAAEPAYANASANYAPENDVSNMTQFAFTPQNFYDPGIAIYMGIRHLTHFYHQAKAAGFTGSELLRHALIGYNTGSVMSSNASWLVQYSDEIGSLAGWYLSTGHLYDAVYTWTGDPRVDRSQPWSWF